MQHNLIVIAGPTASGKSDLAVQLAQYYNCPILSSDSRQCYIELNIGVAKPTTSQLQAVPHYFVSTHSIHQAVNAAVYEQYALACLATLYTKHNTVILVGGTGLYINAICQGMHAVPAIPQEVKSHIQAQYHTHGLPWLVQYIQANGGTYTSSNDTHNTQRMLRAAEVIAHTGLPIQHYYNQAKALRNFNMHYYALDVPRQQLYHNINSRLQLMMQQGLLQEAMQLHAHAHLNALNTVGYTELFQYLNNNISLPQAIALIQQHTRNYAKRQLTWFAKGNTYTWLTPANAYQHIINQHKP